MADRVSLSDPDAEFALVGSLLAWPESATAFTDTIDPEWFTDETARAFFLAARKAGQSGELSRQSVVGNLPEIPDDPKVVNQLYVNLIDRAVPPNAVGGVMSTIREKWARRTIMATCLHVSDAAPLFDSDPFDLTREMLFQADRVVSARKVRDSGSLEQGAATVLRELGERKTDMVTTGLKSFDDKIGGYKRGQLYVIAGRPAMGKSAFGISTLLRTAMSGHGVQFFSLEMTRDDVIARCLSDLSDDAWAPAYGWLLRGKATDHQLEDLRVVADSLAGLPVYFDYSGNMTLREIAAEARRCKAEMESKGTRLDVVCVDHLTLIRPEDRYSGNPVMEVSQNIDGLRVLAKELDCAVVCLCQLSRDVEKREDKRPQLSDLRWTGEIEQAAHVVAFLYREEYYLKNDPKADRYAIAEAQNALDLLIRKNRQGETGDVRLWCDMAHSSVRDPKK